MMKSSNTLNKAHFLLIEKSTGTILDRAIIPDEMLSRTDFIACALNRLIKKNHGIQSTQAIRVTREDQPTLD
jgi:hypothetical protein